MQCRKFFVPRSSYHFVPPSRHALPIPADTPPPALTDVELAGWLGLYALASSKLFVIHRDAVHSFYADRGVPFDDLLYGVGPSRVEARQFTSILTHRGAPAGLPGFIHTNRGPFFPSPLEAEAWEWVHSAEGLRVCYSKRTLKPRKGRPKARIAKGGRQRAHHVLGWRDAVERSGVLAVTEGIRKANELARRTGFGAIGLPSVSFTGKPRTETLAAIAAVRPRVVLLAPDFADMADGEERHDPTRSVVRHWSEIVEHARGLGVEVRALVWDPSIGKGIDDALLHLDRSLKSPRPGRLGLPEGIEELDWNQYLTRWKWHRQPDTADQPEAIKLAEPAPTLEPTRELVRTATEAHQRAHEVASSWVPGEKPLVFCGWPGLGKTTALGIRLLEGLCQKARGFESRVALLALPTRALVAEKAAKLRQIARERGLDVEIVELLGRSHDSASGWFCQAGPERARKLAGLHRSACLGCEYSDVCLSDGGRYLYARARALDAIASARGKSARPVLVITTHAALPWLWDEIPKKSPLVLDDPGALFGLARRVDLLLVDIEAALTALREWRRRNGGDLGVAQREWNRVTNERTLRDRARKSLRVDLRGAKTLEDARDAAQQWAWTVGVDALRAQEKVARLWSNDDASRAIRSLRGMESAATVLPELLVAELVERLLQAMLSHRFASPLDDQGRLLRDDELQSYLAGELAPKRYARELLLAAVRDLPDECKVALRDGCVRPLPRDDGAWPWERIRPEHGEDLVPSFTRVALEVAREGLLIEGDLARPPWARRNKRTLSITLPDRELLARARSGRVAWASVGPMPELLIEQLGARQEIVLAQPDGLQVFALQVITKAWVRNGQLDKCVLSFGPGQRRPGQPSDADLLVRDLAAKISKKVAAGELEIRGQRPRKLGAVLHKVDCEALGSPAWAGHFGRDHAGTDDFSDCELLFVRRSLVPPSAIEREAEVLRRLFGVATPKEATETKMGVRVWSGDDDFIRTREQVEKLEGDLLEFHALSRQLNAVGRCRPLTAGARGRIVILLCGRPFGWLSGVEWMIDWDPELFDQWSYGAQEDLRQFAKGRRPQDLLGVGLDWALLEDARVRTSFIHLAEQVMAEQAQATAASVILQHRPETSTRELSVRLGIAERTARRVVAAEGLRSHMSPLFQSLRESVERVLGGLREASRGHGSRLTSGRAPVEEVINRRARPKLGRPPRSGNDIGVAENGDSDPEEQPKEDIPLVDPFRAALIELLPAPRVVAEMRAGGNPEASRSTVQRALALIREALAEERTVLLPRRSDHAATLAAVLRACIRLLGRTVPSSLPPTIETPNSIRLAERRHQDGEKEGLA